MSGEEFEEELYRENLYYVYKDELEIANKEIERLNNIIDELRKYIGNEYYCFDNESLECKIAKDILNKLQELKGSDNNECKRDV